MKHLDQVGFKAASIHGNKSQGQRERALKAFRDGEIRVLVATDVAARGIDIPGVTHVYNYDLPEVPDAYVHRIGRTARNGRDGIAIAFCAPDEIRLLRDIEKLMGIKIAVASGEAPADQARPSKSRGGRNNGQHRGNGGQRQDGGQRGKRPAREPAALPATNCCAMTARTSAAITVRRATATTTAGRKVTAITKTARITADRGRSMGIRAAAPVNPAIAGKAVRGCAAPKSAVAKADAKPV
jgi:superfamily II DNA/RNA helicase